MKRGKNELCGIAGLFTFMPGALEADQRVVAAAIESMATRGPDGTGVWFSDSNRVILGHRRLSIIDLTDGGSQPMQTPERDLCIVFNGEIYNYQALRDQMVHKGHTFRSTSDTEVLLHLYRDVGPDMVKQLRGMFAFAIWDERRQGLFLARDHFGIKPLYVSSDGYSMRFASQVKALLAGGGVDTTPEPAGHVGYFLWGSVSEPFTLYKGVRAVPAGCTIWLDESGVDEPRRFFNIAKELKQSRVDAADLSPREARLGLRSAMLDSVKHHLIADVPVGLLLSSGLDSATLLALNVEMAESRPSTVTLAFREFEGTAALESPLAELVADHFGAYHETCWVSRNDFVESRDHLLTVMDQPSVDGVNTYFACKVAAALGLKVALSGLGADELFGGYSSFRQIPRLVRCLRPIRNFRWVGRGFHWMVNQLLKPRLPPKTAGLLEYGVTFSGAYLLRRSLFMPWELPSILGEEMVRAGLSELQPFHWLEETIEGLQTDRERVTALEMSWYMRNQLLRDADWASMAHSLELRVPYVDIELFRAVARLQAHNGPISKQDMADTPVRKLPDPLFNRSKIGFSIPVAEWLTQLTPRSPGEHRLRGWAKTIYREQFAGPDWPTARPPFQ